MRPSRWLGVACLTSILLGPGCAPAQDRVPLTLDPIMVRGPAAARVTIVEFSDYQ
jgi:hypothetical protein